ncbi:MAG: helix-turn-helix domain-containing protein, partial [Mycetocola sp.]
MTVLDSRFFELQAAGHSAAEIAAEMGVTTRTVTRWRREAGLTRQLPDFAARPVPAERLAQAERLLEDGAPAFEVAKTLHMSV